MDELNMIDDRSQVDANRAQYLAAKGWNAMTPNERTEWLMILRGSYNHTDWNRVETAVKYLKDLLHSCGYTIAAVGIKTDWLDTDEIRDYDFERYLGNVKAFRYFAPFLSDPPLPESLKHLDWRGANNIERFLSKIYYYIQAMTDAYLYCGEVMCGEE